MYTMSSNRVADAAGLSYRQLDYAIRCGWVQARGGEGSGSTRWFTREEERVVIWGGQLMSIGIKPQLAFEYARRMVEAGVNQITVGSWTISRALPSAIGNVTDG